MNRLRPFTAAIVVALGAGCAPAAAPGMVSSAPRLGEGDTLLVAFPSSACASSESAVFLDDGGRFLGAVAPGTAAALRVPPTSRRVLVFGSKEVFAPPRTWFVRHEVALPADQGILVRVGTGDAKNCRGKWSGPLSPRPEVAPRAAVEAEAQGLSWLAVDDGAGDRWLHEHHARVAELVGRATAPPAAPVVTEVVPPP